MMPKSKFNKGLTLRILALIPLAFILFIGVTRVNGQDKSNVVVAVEPVKMNVLYLGIDNPVKIAASGYESSDLTVSVENGKIIGENGEYIIRPIRAGLAIVTVSSNGSEIQKTTFRVNLVPNPVAMIAGRNGGLISKNELLNQDKVLVMMSDFDFDLNFEIVEYSLYTLAEAGFIREFKSNSNEITEEQKALIEKLKAGEKVYLQDIKCKGPDGSIRELGAINFEVY